MLHQTHSCITRPAFLVVIADNVLVIGIRMFSQVALDQVPSFFSGESDDTNKISKRKQKAILKSLPEENMNSVDVAAEQSNRMTDFGRSVLESQEVVGHLRWTGHFTRSLQAEHE